MTGLPDLDPHFTIIADRLSSYVRLARARAENLDAELRVRRRSRVGQDSEEAERVYWRLLFDSFRVRVNGDAAKSALEHLATSWSLWRTVLARHRHEPVGLTGFCLRVSILENARSSGVQRHGLRHDDEDLHLEISRAVYSALEVDDGCVGPLAISELRYDPLRPDALMELHVRHECEVAAGLGPCRARLERAIEGSARMVDGDSTLFVEVVDCDSRV